MKDYALEFNGSYNNDATSDIIRNFKAFQLWILSKPLSGKQLSITKSLTSFGICTGKEPKPEVLSLEELDIIYGKGNCKKIILTNVITNEIHEDITGKTAAKILGVHPTQLNEFARTREVKNNYIVSYVLG